MNYRNDKGEIRNYSEFLLRFRGITFYYVCYPTLIKSPLNTHIVNMNRRKNTKREGKGHVLTVCCSLQYFFSSSFFFLVILILLGSITVRPISYSVSPSLVYSEEDQELVISALFLSSVDSDGDGLNDSYEEQLGTNVSDYYGDFDHDGLYDFEELLDIYGDRNISSPRFKYNDGTSIGTVLDIYSVHGLDSNKSGYLRDSNFSEESDGFIDYLLWNLDFDDIGAGGSGGITGGNNKGIVVYRDNTLVNVNFSEIWTSNGDSYLYYENNSLTNVIFGGDYAGSGDQGLNFSHNNFTNVIFSGDTAGGVGFGSLSYFNNRFVNVTFSGFIAGGVSSSLYRNSTYMNNTLINVTFSGSNSGGAWIGSGDIKYSYNNLTNVIFSGNYSGGNLYDRVEYNNNHLTNVIFSGYRSGGSYNGSVRYTDNIMTNVIFSGNYSGGSTNSSVSYEGNTVSNVTFSGSHAGGSIDGEITYFNNSMTDVRFSGYYAGGSENGRAVYRSNNMTSVTFDGISAGVGTSGSLLFFLLIASSVLVLILFVCLVSFIYVRRRQIEQDSK